MHYSNRFVYTIETFLNKRWWEILFLGNRIKIIDFGLARQYDPDKKLQVLFGTPEFVAPEVVNFDSITFATDMWSVGVIAYVL